MKAKTAKKSKRPTYFFACTWDNGKGCFNADYESCGCKSKSTTSLAKCVKKAIEHNLTHRWCHWGYPDSGWKNRTVNIHKKVGNKTTFLGEAYDVKV